MVSVKCSVPVYEINGKDVQPTKEAIDIISHWNNPRLVIIVIDGQQYAVRAADLQAAIENARNTAR